MSYLNTHKESYYFTFYLCEDAYAVPLSEIERLIEIHESLEFCKHSNMLIREIDYQGDEISVIDIKYLLKGKSSNYTFRSTILIMKNCKDDEKRKVGIVIDEMEGVKEIESNTIKDIKLKKNRYVNSSVEINGTTYMCIDTDKLIRKFEKCKKLTPHAKT